jgi:hypothetical protein
MNKNFYTCLAGCQIYYDDQCQIEFYPKSLESYFTDPISYEYMTDPVVINGNVYDRTTISKWLTISNMDPLTGVTIINPTICPFNMLRYILYAVEDRGDVFAYYSIPTSRYQAQVIARYMPMTSLNVNKYTNHMRNLRHISLHNLLCATHQIYLSSCGYFSTIKTATCIDRWISNFAQEFAPIIPKTRKPRLRKRSRLFIQKFAERHSQKNQKKN